VSRPRFEPITSQILVRSVAALVDLLGRLLTGEERSRDLFQCTVPSFATSEGEQENRVEGTATSNIPVRPFSLPQ
jgi:hypothetical protein